MRKTIHDSDRDDGCRRGTRGTRRLPSFKAIVRDYKRAYRPRAASELAYFASMRSLGEVIAEAGMARMPSGKRWSHQRRISMPALEYATQALQHANLKAAKSFDELLVLIEAAVHSLRGIGGLYAYDTALRIGAYLRKLPEQVYLHAGTRVGAAALGFDPGERTLARKQLPAPFQTLKPYELEDVLCIYKEWLAGARHS